MAGRQVGVVVDRDRVLAEPARRLHHQHDVARLHRGDDDLAVGSRLRSTNSSPGAGPQCSTTASAARRAAWRTSRGTSLAGIRIGLPASCPSVSQSGSWPPRSISAWISASPSLGVRRRARRRSRYPASRIARSSATALAGVSRPTALPMRACLVGYAENTSATRLSRGGDVRAAGRAARRGRRRGRSAPGRRRRRSGRRRRSP